MPVQFPRRLRGWRFFLLNLMLGLGHMVVLFNAGSYVALLPHAASDLGGVLPSFGTWAQTDFMIALALGFLLARWLACRVGNYRLFAVAFVVYAVALALCAMSDTRWLFLPARVLLGVAGGITVLLGQALWLDEYPDRSKSLGLGLWGVFMLTLSTRPFHKLHLADHFGGRAFVSFDGWISSLPNWEMRDSIRPWSRVSWR